MHLLCITGGMVTPESAAVNTREGHLTWLAGRLSANKLMLRFFCTVPSTPFVV